MKDPYRCLMSSLTSVNALEGIVICRKRVSGGWHRRQASQLFVVMANAYINISAIGGMLERRVQRWWAHLQASRWVRVLVCGLTSSQTLLLDKMFQAERDYGDALI